MTLVPGGYYEENLIQSRNVDYKPGLERRDKVFIYVNLFVLDMLFGLTYMLAVHFIMYNSIRHLWT
jgi:hypothetical protein